VGHDRAPRLWEYELRFAADVVGQPVIKKERVARQGKELLCRPDEHDRKDKYRLTQTYLEQATVNGAFRELAELFASVRYLHLVPQVLRNLVLSAGPNDPGIAVLDLPMPCQLPSEIIRVPFTLFSEASHVPPAHGPIQLG
jgi:hypothetical protein